MIKQYAGADRALTYLFEHAKEVSITPVLTSGKSSAILTIDGVQTIIYCDIDMSQLNFSQLSAQQILDLKSALGIT